MSKIYRIKKFDDDDREKMDFTEWFAYYQENTGIFWKILRQRIRTMRYSLEYGSDLEDLMQEAIERVCRKFEKEKKILEIYKHTTFDIEVRAVIKDHIWKINKFKGLPGKGIPSPYFGISLSYDSMMIKDPGQVEKFISGFTEREKIILGSKVDPAFAGDGERVMVTSDNYLAVDQKIDIAACLDKAEQKIVILLLASYKKTEVADIMKLSRQGIYWKIKVIRKKLEAAGLKPAV